MPVDLGPDIRPETVGGHEVDLGAQEFLELVLELSEGEEASARRDLNHEVDIARSLVFASGDASEHPDGPDSVPCSALPDRRPVTTQPTPEPGVREPELGGRAALEAQFQIVPRGRDQADERREGGLAMTGFVGADHALRHARPIGEFLLSEARTPSGLPEKGAGFGCSGCLH